MQKADKIWMDGEMLDWDDANVHVMTHTLHYGLGAFEGVRCYQRSDGRSQIFRLTDHTRRLFDSTRIVHLDIPFTQDEINEACREVVRANGFDAAYIRPVAFIGDGARGLAAIDNPIHVAIITWQWGAYLGEEALATGVRAKISSWTRNHPNSMMSKGKINGHYVNSILAKREANLAGYDEAIMLDHQGLISEASGENIFIVRDGKVKTPSYSSSILGGITRDCVLTILRENNVPVEHGSFARDELYLADEVFFCGTAAEVTPVREIDNRPIGAGTRGEITTLVQETYFDIVRGSNTQHMDWLDFI